MFDLFQYGFIIRGIEAGVIIALTAPLIGIFLVLKRYSLIADTLAHVSLAGVAIGLLIHINPIITAIITSLLSSLMIEKLRLTRKVYGESALAIFLSASLALAIVLISASHSFNVDLFSYLFGSITTVRQEDVIMILILGIIVAVAVMIFYKELTFITFDEEAARVSGIPARAINNILIILSALTVVLAIPIIGVLLISALVVIPVVAALQLGKSFKQTILYAESISLLSVIAGIFISFYLNLSTGGVIVLLTLAFFAVTFMLRHKT